jgi:hypothetical protein
VSSCRGSRTATTRAPRPALDELMDWPRRPPAA